MRSSAMPDDAAAGAGDEELAEPRLAGAGGGADEIGRGRHVAPAEDPQALLGRDALDAGDDLGRLGVVVRQEGEADGVGAARGQREVDDLAQERVGDLGQDARPVAGVLLGPDRAAVVEVAQRGERQLDDVVPRLTAHGRHEGDAARIVLVRAVVEADGLGLRGEPAEGRDHEGTSSRLGNGRPDAAPIRRASRGPESVRPAGTPMARVVCRHCNGCSGT